MICKHCNYQIPDGSAVCSYCGQPVEAAGEGWLKRPGGLGGSQAPAAANPGYPSYPSNPGYPNTPGNPAYPANPGGQMPPAGVVCPHCGGTLNPGAPFCHHCGSQLGGAAPYKAPQKPGNKGLLIGILVALVAVIGILVAIWLIQDADKDDRSDKSSSSEKNDDEDDDRNSPEDVVKQYMKALFDCDAEGFAEAMGDEVIEAACEEGNMKRSEFIDQLEDSLSMYCAQIAYYAGVDLEDIEWEIEDVEEYDEDDDEYQEMQEAYEDGPDLEISGAATVEITLKVDGEKETMELDVVKIGKKWCVSITAGFGGL